MAGVMAAFLQPLRLLRQGLNTAAQVSSGCGLVQAENTLLSSVRTKVRCYFPRANEVRRVRRHGWDHRMSTPNGRRTIMRRLLKGRYVLTH